MVVDDLSNLSGPWSPFIREANLERKVTKVLEARDTKVLGTLEEG